MLVDNRKRIKTISGRYLQVYEIQSPTEESDLTSFELTLVIFALLIFVSGMSYLAYTLGGG